MLERKIESHLVGEVRKQGGLAMKWTSPSISGVPDRIVFMPGGRVTFIELKAPGKKVTPLQERVHKMLIDLGADVRVLDSEASVDKWIEELSR